MLLECWQAYDVVARSWQLEQACNNDELLVN